MPATSDLPDSQTRPANHSDSDGATNRAFSQIPVIDIAGLYSDQPGERQRVARELAAAASDVGFLYICGHRIPEACLDDLKTVSRRFFAQPLAQKMRNYIGQSVNHSGYVPEGEEQFYAGQSDSPPDHKESYDVGFELEDLTLQRPMLGPNQWPDPWPEEEQGEPDFRQAVSRYYQQALALGQTLFRGFALALGLPEHTFAAQATHPPSQLRLIHYPFDADAADRPGIGAHTDYECFTLLLPTADGLEVLNGEGHWVDAPVKPGCLVVNIGDMLEVLSNGRFIATSHRVRKVQQERYSFPLFCSLNYDTRVEPILPPLAHADADKYQPLVCGDHLYAQTIHTFRYLKERLQRGDIHLPEASKALATFGQYKAVLEQSTEEESS